MMGVKSIYRSIFLPFLAADGEDFPVFPYSKRVEKLLWKFLLFLIQPGVMLLLVKRAISLNSWV
jgi:hypothetical protein